MGVRLVPVARQPAGWYGLGTAIEAYERGARRRTGTDRLRELYATWPFFAGVVDIAEMALAKADMPGGRALREPRRRAPMLAGSGGASAAEYHRTVAAVLRVTGRARLLDAAPVLQRSIELRNPYVDSLSELQVMLLGRLRALPADDPDRDRLLHLVQLTVSGVAAGLQNTG